jgi:predicted permease
MPPWFAYPDAATQLWTPVYHDKPAQVMSSLQDHEFPVIGRLNPGVTAEQGRAELSVIVRRLHDQHRNVALISKAAEVRPLLEDIVGGVKQPLYVLLAATGCVLLIACLNVANLLVARAAARRKELAIRAALGGGRLRLLRERLMESFLLSAAGGTLGLLLAYGAVQWLVHTRQDMSRVEAIHVDGVVALFTVGLVVLCALFTGLIASGTGRDKQLLASLQDSARSSSGGQAHTGLRRALLAVEVGLTVVLLVAAGLLLKSYARFRSSDMGCATQNVLTMRLALFGGRYGEPAQLVNFYTALLARVRALPGVEAAGFVQAVPGQGYWGDNGFTIAEHPPLSQGQAQFALFRYADPDYFAAMRIPILRGRSFDPNQRLELAREVVVSKSFADTYFPGEDPLGKHMRSGVTEVYTIVGVVGDTRYAASEDPKPMQYYPLFEGAGVENNGTLVIRSSRHVERLALPVQRIVQELDHDLPVSDVLTMDQLLGKSTLDESFNATLARGLCGALAAACRRGAVWRAVLHRGAANQRDRHSHGAGRAAGAGAAVGAAGWAAAGALRACIWSRGQRGRGAADPVDALWNAAARSGRLCLGRCNAAAGGGAGLHGSGLARLAARSHAGAQNGIGAEGNSSAPIVLNSYSICSTFIA